ncbi:MAG: ABC transporter ATP-binding protein [Thermomicrobiales bacterium]|nr:ABC transporter ATP-binding protein [Thermomicrobiales bacterium]
MEFDRVSRVYSGADHAAVSDVILTIEPGRFVVLLGPSGCGKTTLLKMVNRLIEPTSGTIRIDGEDIRQMNAATLRRRIGYVIQQTGLFPHMRIEENIAVVPRLLGWPKESISQRVDELLDLIGLPHAYRRRYPAQLSGGEQQRVGLARALAVDPSMMLMDEPFGALDAITRLRLQDELLAIHRQLGQTILFVTHDIDEAIRLADEIVVLRAGQVIQHGSPLDIVTAPADDFVRDLVGGGEALRRLSLIDAGSALNRNGNVRNEGLPAVTSDANLRTVLNLLLQTGTQKVTVTDENGAPVGTLGIPDIWSAGLERGTES